MTTERDETDELDDELTCPVCGWTADFQSFNDMGACEGCVFCLQCSAEINDDGTVHEHGECCRL